MITKDDQRINTNYTGYKVVWAKYGDKDSFTYAVGGRSGCKCSGIHVSQSGKEFNIRVVPTTSYFWDSASIVIAIPPEETAIADVATAFIGMLDSYEPTEETSFDEYMESVEKEAKDIITDTQKYSEFLQLPKYEFLKMYPYVTRVAYSLLSMELHGNLRALNGEEVKDE